MDLSVADGVAGLEGGVIPHAGPTGLLRLLAPWREDLDEQPGVAQSAAAAVVVPTSDHRASAVALRDVLWHWRAIRRELDAMFPDNLDRSLLEAQADALRAVHARLFAEVNRD